MSSTRSIVVVTMSVLPKARTCGAFAILLLCLLASEFQQCNAWRGGVRLPRVTATILSASAKDTATIYHSDASQCNVDSLPVSSARSGKDRLFWTKFLQPASVAAFSAAVLASTTTISKESMARAEDLKFLKDPTAEFVEEQKKTAALKAAQLKIRADWDKIITKLEKSETAAETEAILKEMTAFLGPLDGIPTGVKKLPIVKLCRSKKFNGRKIKPTWTKAVEIAYEAFIQAFNKAVSPDNKTDRGSF